MKTSNRIRLSRPAETEESPAVTATRSGFVGAVDGRVDERNRIALPSRLRNNALGDLSIVSYFVTPDAHLRILSQREQDRISARLKDHGTSTEAVRLYTLYRDDMRGEASIDVQGRLLIDATFLTLIGVDSKRRDVRIIPHDDYIDIWEKGRLAAFKAGDRRPINEEFREYLEVESKLKL